MKEGSLERPQVALCGPKCPLVVPKDATGHPKGDPRDPEMEAKAFQNVTLYKKLENLKNDDATTRKQHF